MILTSGGFYLCVSKDLAGIIEAVREYFEKSYYKSLSEWRMSGGRSGDLYRETAQLDQYDLLNGSAIQLYTVRDDNTNGYAELVSIFPSQLFFNKTDGEAEKLMKFLTPFCFVRNHQHLRERPFPHNNYFDSYLDEWYEPKSTKPFGHS